MIANEKDGITESEVNNLDIVSKVQMTATNSTTTSSTDIDDNGPIAPYSCDDDSSLIDSDSDVDDVINFNESKSNEIVRESDINQPSCSQSNSNTNTNIVVQNSSGFTFENGNKTFFQGPVTINQIVNDKNKLTEDTSQESSHGLTNIIEIPNVTQSIQGESVHENEIKEKKRRMHKLAVITRFIVGVLICSVLTVVLVFALKYDGGNQSILPDSDLISMQTSMITINDSSLKVFSRSEWGAQPSANVLDALELPSHRVIIAHTAAGNCSTQTRCVYLVRNIQQFHIETKGLDDISYNFLVGGDGAVYVGRGWDVQGDHTKGYNTKSICIAFIGLFTKQTPPKCQIEAAQKIIQEGVKMKKLSEDYYRLYGHRQLQATESPGSALYSVIREWDHWTDKVE